MLSFLRRLRKLPVILVFTFPIVYWLTVARIEEGFQIVRGKPAIVGSAPLERTVRYIREAEAESFRALDSAEGAQAIYAVDAHSVFIGMNNHAMRIESADPSSFGIMTPDGDYASDKDRVFWYGREVTGANPQTFVILKVPYGIDGHAAFAGIERFEVKNLGGFEVISVDGYDRPIGVRSGRLSLKSREDSYVSGWCRDGEVYYWGCTYLEGADYNTLSILNSQYAKDHRTVFYRGKRVPGADAESFVTVGPGDVKGKDARNEYSLGKRVGSQ